MKLGAALLLLAVVPALRAQTVCATVAVGEPCEAAFTLTAQEAGANPYRGVDITVEFRAPSHQTYLAPAFWDGGTLLKARIEPDEPGTWDYRVSGVARFEGKVGHFQVTPGKSGFVQPANVFHFWTMPGKQPHLWMGAVAPAGLDPAAFEALAATRQRQHFNHLRIDVLGAPAERVFEKGDLAQPAWFQKVDAEVLAANRHGITADLVIAGPANQLTRLFPEHEQRDRYVRFLCARYAGLDITWQGLDGFETYQNGRELLAELAPLFRKWDGYHHPLSSAAQVSSAGLLGDHWMKYLTYRTADATLGAVERQFYAMPAINDFNGDGNTDADTFRHRLWNASMNGQYPEATVPNERAAEFLKIWYEFFAQTRHWELSPFFDVDGGRALTLEDVEYIVYVEHPGPVELRLDQKRKYDIRWLNPVTGESVEFKPDKAETIQGTPPDSAHDWVLYVSRESHKASMAKSYYFESRTADVQEIEADPAKLPFTLELPAASDSISASHPTPYRITLKKETRASKAMQYVITGEVTADGQGSRVLATGARGVLTIPPNLAQRYPALLHLRIEAVNGVGKAYSFDQNFTLAP